MSYRPGFGLAALASAAAFVFAPVAAADPDSPSYGQGKQAIDEQVQQYHVQLSPSTDWGQYCQRVLNSDLKSGKISRVDSPADFVAGCGDEGRALVAAH
ncbi:MULTISPECIES: hypothetical protein [unclassified Mycobacterium]|uniref:hypothetical protein n=1 Tax=unclassified Mycobacterium TaxID=2642494 RepID=UPI001E5BE978|nr:MULTISPECIES: hypothetical protein [unclassified Mycobacterium]